MTYNYDVISCKQIESTYEHYKEALEMINTALIKTKGDSPLLFSPLNHKTISEGRSAAHLHLLITISAL